MKNKVILCICVLGLVIVSLSSSLSVASENSLPKKDNDTYSNLQRRWSAEKANRWYDSQPWIIGCNYVTSTAINQIEMWQEETFDPETIEKEMALAESIGFNTVRVFIHDLIWEADAEGFKKRLDRFFDICEKHHIKVIFTFFTNGSYSFKPFEPYLGKQPDPVPGVHNSGWVQSPGSKDVNDPNKWGRLERYVRDIISTYANDDRILLWCLYNEPWNKNKGANTLPLLREVFDWARDINPTQPLTATIRGGSLNEMDCFLLENCDVITFHSYESIDAVKPKVQLYKDFGRPVVCTEYMARPRGSTFGAILPFFQSERIGAISFGLVAGKGNFQYPWGSKEGSPEPAIWFHDIFRNDGAPYDINEVRLIKELSKGN